MTFDFLPSRLRPSSRVAIGPGERAGVLPEAFGGQPSRRLFSAGSQAYQGLSQRRSVDVQPSEVSNGLIRRGRTRPVAFLSLVRDLVRKPPATPDQVRAGFFGITQSQTLRQNHPAAPRRPNCFCWSPGLLSPGRSFPGSVCGRASEQICGLRLVRCQSAAKRTMRLRRANVEFSRT